MLGLRLRPAIHPSALIRAGDTFLFSLPFEEAQDARDAVLVLLAPFVGGKEERILENVTNADGIPGSDKVGDRLFPRIVLIACGLFLFSVCVKLFGVEVPWLAARYRARASAQSWSHTEARPAMLILVHLTGQKRRPPVSSLRYSEWLTVPA